MSRCFNCSTLQMCISTYKQFCNSECAQNYNSHKRIYKCPNCLKSVKSGLYCSEKCRNVFLKGGIKFSEKK